MHDREKGTNIGKGAMELFFKMFGSAGSGGLTSYTISVHMKEGKYKYEITGFTHPMYGACENLIEKKVYTRR